MIIILPEYLYVLWHTWSKIFNRPRPQNSMFIGCRFISIISCGQYKTCFGFIHTCSGQITILQTGTLHESKQMLIRFGAFSFYIVKLFRYIVVCPFNISSKFNQDANAFKIICCQTLCSQKKLGKCFKKSIFNIVYQCPNDY